MMPLALSANTDSSSVIYSDAGASKWDEGYPIGNGRLGLLSLGTFPSETFYLNETSIWARQEVDFRDNAAEVMKEVRALAVDGKYAEADTLMTRQLIKPTWRPASYEFAGMATLEHLDVDQPISISNTLDLFTGLNRSQADYADGSIIRESIALRERDVIAVRISTTRKSGLHFKLGLTHPRDTVSIDGNKLVLAGQAATGGTKYESHLLAKTIGRRTKITEADGALVIKGGREIVIFYNTATDYNIKNPDEPVTIWRSKIDESFSRTADTSWETLQTEAQSEMRAFMDRFHIDLGVTDPAVAALPTGERIQKYRDGGSDPELEALLFQFGRYALVASNRETGLPNNLQGIWSEGLVAPWSGDYHLNINLQMNYWPSETTGLGELHIPFLDLVRDLQPAGKALARNLGFEGFACGHAVNAFKNTWFSGGKAMWGASLMNGAWITAHLMEHYRYSGDREFLQSKAWPLIQENARFILSWLHRNEQTGKWVTGPGTSPENEFFYTAEDGTQKSAAISIGNTHDLMIAWESLSDLIEAADELGVDNDLVQRVRAVLPQLAEGKIAADGRLQEWSEPFEEKNPGHRHVSHAYGFFPSRQYNVLEDTEMVEAIRKSLDFRLANDGGRTGWSRAWLINIEACLLRPEAAYGNLRTLLSKLVNPNLFDMHPPFQIDGNFGYTSGIVTMLLQSQIQLDSGERVLCLLPALPKAWPVGEVRGLRARGGAIIDLKWSPKTITADISGDLREDYIIRYGDQNAPLSKGATRVEISNLGKSAVPKISIH